MLLNIFLLIQPSTSSNDHEKSLVPSPFSDAISDPTQYGTVRVTPEWHITDKLTLKNAFTNYVNAPKNKNEITLVYSPALKKYAESLKFELGVAESYYSNGSRSSAVSFSTGFKL